MCGIATILRFRGSPVDSSVLEAMTDAVRHRGPDGMGTTFLVRRDGTFAESDVGSSADWQVGLGHRRLSIIDLSEAGKQPMCYRNRLWITYNGEIYNYVELRDELERLGQTFHSHSDTEVILAAYDAWGTDCFARMRGMWGLVLIDGRRKVAICSRDRLGIKPLYLAQAEGLLVAASEIKQFFAVPQLSIKPDRHAIASYLATGYEQQSRTFFDGVTPLPPGTWMEVDLEGGRTSEPEPYWFPERIEVAIHDADEAARRLREKLEESVRIHLRSDVPVGCALSGGLDSSSISACVGRLTSGTAQKFETFSVTFPGSPIDERRFADEVARLAHASPHYITPTPQDFLNDLDRWLWIHDEPVGSLAQYAAYGLARLTRETKVPVTLNGQGGDEVLGGYWQSYFVYLRGLARNGHALRVGRHLAGAMLPGGNPELPRQIPFMLRRYRARSHASTRQNGATGSEGSNTVAQIMSMNERERRIFDIRQMYLPRLLKWDDRNFMAFGVEGRYPFLDHELIELALSFSPEVLFRRGWTKEPLRRGMEGLLPNSILRRRTKLGFETPQDSWLCGQLRPTVENWLADDAPLWDFIDRSEARRVAEETWSAAGRRDEPGQMLLRIYLVDRWMRVFFNPTDATLQAIRA
jgi:asparagine synthase (glutamine-hydrolysing)